MLMKLSTQVDKLVFMTDSSDHVSGKTGLTLTITASKGAGAFNSISPTVVERANGWYAVTFTTTHSNTLGDFAIHVTGSGADPTDMKWLVVTDLPGDTVASVTGLEASVRTAIGMSAADLDKQLGKVASGTAQTSGYRTITLAAGASAVDDYYANCIIVITGGAGINQAAWIESYNGTTKVATIRHDWYYGYPDNTSTYMIAVSHTIMAGSEDYALSIGALYTDSGSDTYDIMRSELFNYTIGGGTPQGGSVAAYLSDMNDELDNFNLNIFGGTGVYVSTGAQNEIADTTWGWALVASNDPGTFGEAVQDIPTADENADALLDRADGIETGWTLRKVLRVMSSVLLGKTSGGGTATETFRNITDTKNRVVSTNDGTDRTSVTLDGT